MGERSTELDRRPLIRIVRSSGLFVFLVGILVLLGWTFDIEHFRSVFPGLVSMKANTALGLLFLGFALLVVEKEFPRSLVTISLLLPTLLGLLTALEYSTGMNFGIDELLFVDTVDIPFPPGRMAFATALAFMMIGLSLFLYQQRRWMFLAQTLALLTGLIATISLVGYLFDEKAIYFSSPYTSLALNTALAFFALSVGTLALDPHAPPISLFSDHSTGGVVARRLLPVSVGTTLFLGWLVRIGSTHDIYHPNFGIVLFAVLNAGVLGVLIWYNARKLSESDALRVAAQNEVKSLNAFLERRVEERTLELAAVNKELEAFCYTVSHDLRAPLRGMQGFAQALMEDYGERFDATGRKYAERIVAGSQRMEELIQDLLSYSRLSRDELPLQRVVLNEVAADVLQQISGDILLAKAEITVENPMPTVIANKSALSQALQNLFTNAVKFARPGTLPKVRIFATTQDGTVRLNVEDNGIGIASEHFKKIFQVFERLHSNEAFPGTGIGLAIVKKAAERMGGCVGVESNVGQGSRFWIELTESSKG